MLFATHSFEEFTEGHIESSRESRQVAKSYLACTPLEIRDMNLVNTRLFGEVDLPPAPLLSELPDSSSNLDADIGVHSSSIDLVEALYLVDALSGLNRVEDPMPYGSWMIDALSAAAYRRCQGDGEGHSTPKILRILKPRSTPQTSVMLW